MQLKINCFLLQKYYNYIKKIKQVEKRGKIRYNVISRECGDNMKKNLLKIMNLIIIIITCISMNLCCYEVYAGGGGGHFGTSQDTDIVNGINTDFYKPSSADNAKNANLLKDMANTIIGFIQIIGSILSVVVLVVLGIKYMMGSAEEKAEYKQSMKPYIIGAIMVFGITNILSIIANISKTLLY